ncbi:hypothetical protein C8R43DRAFT_833013, partial [Mycena crocata]
PGYIPHPPNAFQLFRSWMTSTGHAQKLYAASKTDGEPRHFAKVIGACWRNLSEDDRRIWDSLANEAHAEYRRQYPMY